MEGHRAIHLIDSESALKTQQNYFQTTNPNPQKPTKPKQIMCKKTKLDATITLFHFTEPNVSIEILKSFALARSFISFYSRY